MKKYILAGLLVWLPLAITVWVLLRALGIVSDVFGLLLSGLQVILPGSHDAIEELRHIPGLGLLILGGGVLLTGMFAANMVGQWAIRQWNRVLTHIPIVKNIYSSVKQVSDTLFSSNGNAFREAVLVQYPREGSWTIAFVTGAPSGEVAEALGDDMVSLYVPTTPNPTSGFFLMMPRASVRVLRMSVDEALKHIISMGVVAPPDHDTTPDCPEELAALGAQDVRPDLRKNRNQPG